MCTWPRNRSVQVLGLLFVGNHLQSHCLNSNRMLSHLTTTIHQFVVVVVRGYVVVVVRGYVVGRGFCFHHLFYTSSFLAIPSLSSVTKVSNSYCLLLLLSILLPLFPDPNPRIVVSVFLASSFPPVSVLHLPFFPFLSWAELQLPEMNIHVDGLCDMTLGGGNLLYLIHNM